MSMFIVELHVNSCNHPFIPGNHQRPIAVWFPGTNSQLKDNGESSPRPRQSTFCGQAPCLLNPPHAPCLFRNIHPNPRRSLTE